MDRPERSGPPYELSRALLERQVRIETYRASGPGGQHLHKTESAVRLTHPPSGVVVTASDTRSQARNREIAFARLTERLRQLNRRPKPRKPTRPSRAAKARRLESKKRHSALKRLRTSRFES
jgi:protein subunit release factor B